MTSYHAPLAWLGGPSLASNVLFSVEHGQVTNIRAAADPTEASRLGGIVLPGLVSAHSHAFHRALRGKTHGEGGDFWAWRNKMYAMANRLNPTTYRRLATEVFGEMLRAGITAVGEFHYLHHQPDGAPYAVRHAMEHAIVGAARDSGIRLTLIDTRYLSSDIDGSPPLPEQRRFSDGTVNDWATRVRELAESLDTPTVRLGVAAHSVRAVPAPDLPNVAALADELDAPVHVHISEQRAENAACRAAHGTSPTALLRDTGVLNQRATAVHATHLEESNIAIYGSSGAGVCLCPTTERELGDGIGPAIELRDAGVRLSLGSDSNAVVDLFEEARALELNDRLRLERRGIHAPEHLMTAATSGGMRALGWGDWRPLSVGAPADFIVLDPNAAELAGFETADGVGGLLFAATPRAVSDVVVAGEQVIRNGENVGGQSPTGLAAAILAVSS